MRSFSVGGQLLCHLVGGLSERASVSRNLGKDEFGSVRASTSRNCIVSATVQGGHGLDAP
jgi:hypothetical protein